MGVPGSDDSGGGTSGGLGTSSGLESSGGCDTDECVCEIPAPELPEFCEEEMELCECKATPGQPGPVPDGADVFNCTANRMKYCRGDSNLCRKCDDKDEDDNPHHFDCDDYSLACAIWANQQDPKINVCQMAFQWDGDDEERICKHKDGCGKKYTTSGGGHAINIVEFDDEYCLIEPQTRPPDKDADGDGVPDQRVCCWPKGAGAKIDQVPNECLMDACERYDGYRDDECKITKISCGIEPLPNAGEKPFYVNPGTCKLIGDKCGIVVEPPPPAPVCNCENDVNADEYNGNGWTCAENTCRFLQNGDEQNCHCTWTHSTPAPSGPVPQPVP